MKTVLYDRHVDLGARIVDFAGWEMPVQYQGVIPEHHAVRRSVGLFDVSHMGLILVKGPQAEELLDYASTAVIKGKKDGMATYTVWPNSQGGCVDDVIIFREGPEDFYVVANAGNREKDLQHIQELAKGYDVEVTDGYATWGILAVQGPKARALVSEIFPEAQEMRPMRCQQLDYKGHTVRLSTTGYTGSGGVEIIVPNEGLVPLWDELMDKGEKYGIQPIGLGARDTLRLEMGFALYGHELGDTFLPNETVSAWTVKLAKKEHFHGREPIAALQESGKKRSACGVILQEKGIAREGCAIFLEGEKIGEVTSGTLSPSLGQAIAIALVDRPLQEGKEVKIQVRNRQITAKVVAMPFVDPKQLQQSE